VDICATGAKLSPTGVEGTMMLNAFSVSTENEGVSKHEKVF